MIDTRLPESRRQALLEEVRGHLPGFLSASSHERGGPLEVAKDLLQMRESDMRRLLAVHLSLSDEVRSFCAALANGLRAPVTDTLRRPITSRVVAGGIDWAATTRLHATGAPMGGEWVVRPAVRNFDLPENRALAWALNELETVLSLADPRQVSGAGGPLAEIPVQRQAVSAAKRAWWIRGVSGQRADQEAWQRLNAARSAFYKVELAQVLRILIRFREDPSEQDITDLLARRFFEPTQDWRLFEISVVLRIARALAQLGPRVARSTLLVGGRGYYSAHRLSPQRVVRLWYQTWPASTAPSELRDAMEWYQIEGSGTRPDVVIEVQNDDTDNRALLLELKASASADYLGQGLQQLLGYLRDRPSIMHGPASGWLVVPSSHTFSTKNPEGRALWVVDADRVAEAVAEAVAV